MVVLQQLDARQMPDTTLDWYLKAKYDKSARVHRIAPAAMYLDRQGDIRLVYVREG